MPVGKRLLLVVAEGWLLASLSGCYNCEKEQGDESFSPDRAYSVMLKKSTCGYGETIDYTAQVNSNGLDRKDQWFIDLRVENDVRQENFPVVKWIDSHHLLIRVETAELSGSTLFRLAPNLIVERQYVAKRTRFGDR